MNNEWKPGVNYAIVDGDLQFWFNYSKEGQRITLPLDIKEVMDEIQEFAIEKLLEVDGVYD